MRLRISSSLAVVAQLGVSVFMLGPTKNTPFAWLYLMKLCSQFACKHVGIRKLECFYVRLNKNSRLVRLHLMKLCVCYWLALLFKLGSLSEFLLSQRKLALRANIFDEVVCWQLVCRSCAIGRLEWVCVRAIMLGQRNSSRFALFVGWINGMRMMCFYWNALATVAHLGSLCESMLGLKKTLALRVVIFDEVVCLQFALDVHLLTSIWSSMMWSSMMYWFSWKESWRRYPRESGK